MYSSAPGISYTLSAQQVLKHRTYIVLFLNFGVINGVEKEDDLYPLSPEGLFDFVNHLVQVERVHSKTLDNALAAVA